MNNNNLILSRKKDYILKRNAFFYSIINTLSIISIIFIFLTMSVNIFHKTKNNNSGDYNVFSNNFSLFSFPDNILNDFVSPSNSIIEIINDKYLLNSIKSNSGEVQSVICSIKFDEGLIESDTGLIINNYLIV